MKDIKRDIVERIMDYMMTVVTHRSTPQSQTEFIPEAIMEANEILLEAKREIEKLRIEVQRRIDDAYRREHQ